MGGWHWKDVFLLPIPARLKMQCSLSQSDCRRASRLMGKHTDELPETSISQVIQILLLSVEKGLIILI